MASDQLPPPTTTEEDTPTPTATASELPATATEPVVAADEPEGEGGAQQAETEKVEEKEDEPAAKTTLPRQSLEVEGSDLEEEMNQVSLETEGGKRAGEKEETKGASWRRREMGRARVS